MQNISVVIITYNEEKNIRECLESVKWAGEIIIVDAFSKDNTLGIARTYTDKIFRKEWLGYGRQKNFGLSQVSNDWVLFLDADERLSDSLMQEIQAISSTDNNKYDGYYIPRQSFYLGRWIKHGEWYPDLKLRLVKKEKAKWNECSVHEKIILDGEVDYLKNPIYHYTYRNISHHLEKFNRYSSLFAGDAFKDDERATLCKMFFKSVFRFINGYLLKQGFKDGFPGFVIAAMQSFEVLLRYAKLREVEKTRPAGRLNNSELKRITILHSEWSLGFGGQELRILAEAQHLRKRGFTVEIACQPDSQIIRYANNMGITTHAIRMRSIYDVSAVIKFMRLLRQRKIKILNTHSSIDSYLASIAARLIGGIKIVRSRHLDIPTKSKFIYKFPHRIITTGESIRKDIISRNYVSADRVISIPTGVDTKRFNPILYDRNKVRAELGISANIPLIGMIAFTRIMKGYPFFLEAAEKVLKEIPQAMFLVVGSGPPGREQELKELAVRLGIENSVKFTGFREDIPEVLSALDVFVLSSIHSEGVPQALLQALLMEKPVVATNVGSISEAVIDNKTGVLVSSRNSLALAEGILKILRKPDFKLEIAKAGRKLIEEKFTLNQMVDKIEKVYCELH